MAPPGAKSYQFDTAGSGAILNSFFTNSAINKVGIRPNKGEKMPQLPMPKPKIDYRLSQMIVQCNQLIRLAETECDISLMINAMITQKALLQQAIEESVQWLKHMWLQEKL
jgi:hypothetical protein